MTREADVVIIGGGIAGLSAAWTIANASGFSGASNGIRIVLLESRRNAGGRAGSFTDPASGETTDYCQHVAMGCCTNFIDLMKQAGLLDCFTRYPSLNFYHPSTGVTPFRPSTWLPAPLHLHRALAGLRYLSLWQKTRIRIAIWKLMRSTDPELQDVVAATWLATHHQDSEICKRFWDVILVSALGDVPQHVSMAAARKVIIEGFAAARGASDVWVPNEPLSFIFGKRMVAALTARGVDVRLGVSVRGIESPDDLNDDSSSGSRSDATISPRPRVLLSDGSPLRADHVVVATSWRAASRLIQTIDTSKSSESVSGWQQNMMTTLNEIRASPITGLHLWFDRVLTPLPHVAMVGTTAHWLFRQPIPPSLQTESQTGIYHQVVISGRHDLSDAPKEQLVARVLEELRIAFPAAADAVLIRSRVVTDPTAVYRVSPEFQSRRPSVGTPLRWLHLAGDYVQTGWPATMEGATISGRRAADSVLEPFGECANHPGGSPGDASVLPAMRPGPLARFLVRR